MLPHKTWMYVRLVVVAIGAVYGPALIFSDTGAESRIDWISCIVILLFSPVALLLIVGLQSQNPLSSTRWRKPSWLINPFLFEEPLQFFHLAAYHFLAAGVTACVSTPFIRW